LNPRLQKRRLGLLIQMTGSGSYTLTRCLNPL